MSVILITNHNECIYNVAKTDKTPTVQKVEAKDTKYVPNVALRREIRKTLKKGTKPHGTMGLPKQPPKKPQDYLRKGTGKPPMLPFEREPKEIVPASNVTKRKLPPVPARDDVLRETADKIRHEKRDHLTKNIKLATTMAPKIPARKVAITIDGITRDLSAGLEPQHITRDEFGKVPCYLANLIKIKQSLMERQKDMMGTQQPKCVYITHDEREELLNGLKQNWEELQRTYQGLPILTDTIPKRNRKVKLESDLKQLEKDIVLIERHPYIYVYEDQKDL